MLTYTLIVDYEGEDASAQTLPFPPPKVSASPPPIKKPIEEPPEMESPEASDDDGSEDDYVAEPVQKRVSSYYPLLLSKYQGVLSDFFSFLIHRFMMFSEPRVVCHSHLIKL